MNIGLEITKVVNTNILQLNSIDLKKTLLLQENNIPSMIMNIQMKSIVFQNKINEPY